MNEKLYRKCGLYRLFFIEELLDRKHRRNILAIRRLKRKAAELALKQFESDMKRQNYGDALVTAQLYFLILDDF